MLAKIAILLTGISFTVFGRYLLFNRRFHQWDLGPIDMGPYHWGFGVIFIIGGLFVVYEEAKIMIRDKRKSRPPREGD